MKRIIRAFVYVPASHLHACREALPGFRLVEEIGPVPGSRFFLHYRIERKDLDALNEASAAYRDRDLSVREECVFTKRELNEAELLAVRMRRSPLDFMDVHEGMQYDYDIAPTRDNPVPWCWQLTPRLMRRKDLPAPRIGIHHTVPGEIIAHESLVSLFKDEYIRLNPVVADGVTSEWQQLCGKRVMPPYDRTTTGVAWPPHSHAENPPASSPPNIYDVPQEGYWPAYPRQAVLDQFSRIPEISFTFELYGQWGPGDLKDQVAPPQPRLLVGHQTRRALIDAGVRFLEYVPVRWVDR